MLDIKLPGFKTVVPFLALLQIPGWLVSTQAVFGPQECTYLGADKNFSRIIGHLVRLVTLKRSRQREVSGTRCSLITYSLHITSCFYFGDSEEKVVVVSGEH